MKHFFWRICKPTGCTMLILAAFALFFIGCAGSGKPQYNVENYLLNYPAPSGQKTAPLAASIKFNRFSIAAVYNTANMIFRSGDYTIDTFNYSRWAVNPADMVADDLLRDLQASELYSAVYSRYDVSDGRFALSGGIEEFYLKADDRTKAAVISLVISLKDTGKIASEKKLLFQKKYKQEVALEESSPRGYARAASIAMQALSAQIRADLYAAIQSKIPK